MFNIEMLSNSILFKNVDRKKIDLLISKLHFSLYNYQDGNIIVHEGEPLNSVKFVYKGIVKTFFKATNGREVNANILTPPLAIAQGSLFMENANFPVSAIAKGDVTMLVISREELFKLLKYDEQILRNFLTFLSEFNNDITNRIRILLMKTIPQKLAFYIISLLSKNSNIIRLPISQTQLADFLAVTRPSLARGLRQLKELGLIDFKARVVKVLNREKLEDLIYN